MTKISLSKYLEENSQESLAKAIGYRQSAISNMLKAERNISVITHDDGRIELLEEKIIGPALQKTA